MLELFVDEWNTSIVVVVTAARFRVVVYFVLIVGAVSVGADIAAPPYGVGDGVVAVLLTMIIHNVQCIRI